MHARGGVFGLLMGSFIFVEFPQQFIGRNIKYYTQSFINDNCNNITNVFKIGRELDHSPHGQLPSKTGTSRERPHFPTVVFFLFQSVPCTSVPPPGCTVLCTLGEFPLVSQVLLIKLSVIKNS
jgi:hypothetical protein